MCPALPRLRGGFVRSIFLAFGIIVLFCVIVILVTNQTLVPSSVFFSPTPSSAHSATLQHHHQRRTAIRDYCSPTYPNYTIADDSRRYFSFSESHRLVYCSIQKVGTSFWLRVMKILNGKIQKGKLFKKSFQHSFGILGYYSFREKSPAQMEQILRSYKKFMFVRDPYSRLFSAFMDKIFLPTRRVKEITEEGELMGLDVEGTARKESSKCLLNVTFQTFLTVIAQGGMQDPHWSPMHEHCQPCSVDFDFIGKMESFMEDTQFILHQAGVNLSTLTWNETSFDYDIDLTTLTDLARIRLDSARYHKCASETYICRVMQKIWITLQTRGLLSKSVPYPFPKKNCDAINTNEFVQRLIHIYKNQPGSRRERMLQRKEALIEAYSALPRWLLKKVEEYVHVDCTMFGYNCSVEARFPVRNSHLIKTEYLTQFG